MRLRVTSALWILALAFAEPLSAHHSVQAVLVTVSALPARDGSSNGALRELKLADGRDFKFGGEDPNDN